jgi:hypothetical protein
MPGHWLTSDSDGFSNNVLHILTAYNMPPRRVQPLFSEGA